LKGFKGNIRGEHIEAPFTTLEEMLRTLPPSLGVDIELSK
jgi:glycerophosphodiester phosphodiesterase